MNDSPFVIDIADLVARPGSQRRTALTGRADYALELARLADEPVTANLLLESLTDGILVSGEADYVVRLTCNRCLREWEERGSTPFRQLFTDGPDEAGYPLGPDLHLDVEQLLRDEITLSFPLIPLCRPDCAGLCATCGADLNEDACPGHGEEIDSPFAVLRDLLE